MKKAEGVYFFNDSSNVDLIASSISVLYPSVSFTYNKKSIMIVANEKAEIDCIINSVKDLERLHTANFIATH